MKQEIEEIIYEKEENDEEEIKIDTDDEIVSNSSWQFLEYG